MMLAYGRALPPFWLSGLAVGVASALAVGCSCEEDRPYTPFSVATSAPTAPDSSALPSAGPTAGPLVEVAPPLASTWTVFDATLTAPPEGIFLSAALVGERGESAAVVAWVDGPDAIAGLWSFSAKGTADRRLTASPAFLPRASDCKPSVQLQPSGKSTVAVDLIHQCGSRQLPGAAERAFLVMNLQSAQPLVHGLRVAPLSTGETLGISVNGADLDGDGADDIAVELALTSPSGASESMTVHWLLRPAGSSRQKDTPGQEFLRKARELVTAGQRKADRAGVPARVDGMRRLFSAVCAESGAARVMQWDGAPFSCGRLDAALPSLTLAAVHAHLGIKQPGRAIGEFERASWYGSGASEAERSAAEKIILSRVSKGSPRMEATLQFPLGARPSGVFVRRLEFDGNGTLHTQTTDGVTHAVWPAAKPAADGQVPPPLEPWSLSTESADGRLVAGVLPSCDQSELQVAVSKGTSTTTTPLPLLAPRPGQCKKWGGGPLNVELVGWSPEEPILAVGGEVIRPSGGPFFPHGISTSLGFAVETEGKLQLWRDPYFTEGLECAAHDRRSFGLVACVKGDTITVWRSPESFE